MTLSLPWNKALEISYLMTKYRECEVTNSSEHPWIKEDHPLSGHCIAHQHNHHSQKQQLPPFQYLLTIDNSHNFFHGVEVRTSTRIYNEKVSVPMHIDITPNRQSLPRFFISCNSVATHRAPTKKKNRKTC